MSYANGPRIVTNNLGLYLDAGNRKSYPSNGTAWNDLSGNGRGGTLTNGPTFSSENNGIFILDGTNDYTLLNATQINALFPTSAFSIETWIKTSNTTNYMGIFCIGYALDIYYYSNSFFVILRTALGQINTGNSNIIINDNKWHQIGFTASSTEFVWYMDGIIRHTVSSAIWDGSLSTAYATNFSGLGRPSNLGGYFPGSMSSFKFYQKKLSNIEIAENYKATKGRFGL